MQVLVAGHSFICRMALDMRQRGLTLGTENYSIGISGTTIDGHKPIFSHIKHQTKVQKYSHLVVNVGSNDLDLTRNSNINISQLARELVTQAQEIGLHCDLKVVKVWVHKGLFKRDSCYLDRHGVHLNFRGTIKYFHLMQAAVRCHAKDLK